MLNVADELKPLYRWLIRVNARLLWEHKLKGDQRHITLSAFHIGRGIAIVQLMISNHGRKSWELFIPASEKNEVADTLDAAAAALGVDGCAGLLDDDSQKGGAA